MSTKNERETMKLSKDVPPRLDVRYFVEYLRQCDDKLMRATFDLCEIYCGNEKLILEFPKKYELMAGMIKLMLDDYSYELTDFPFELRFK